MTLNDVLFQCLRHFAHMDESNAAMHCAAVRYSPITFRLAEELMAQSSALTEEDDGTISRVMSHVGQYAEDTGR